MIRPERIRETEVTFEACQPDKACLDKQNFKALIINRLSTESYIRQLEQLLDATTEPIR